MVQSASNPNSRSQPNSRSTPPLKRPPGSVWKDTDLYPDVFDWIPEEEWESDEPPLESDLHRSQIDLLVRLLKWYWRERPDFYVSGNTTVFYDPEQLTTRNFRGPDFYVCLEAEKRDRKSWMVWKEGGRFPNLVIELLSDSTANVDRTTKKALYQDTWRLPNYFWFDTETLELQGFQLVDGSYQAIAPNEKGHLWSEQLGLYIGIHNGVLRLFDAEGNLALLPEEEANQKAEQAQEKAARLAAKLRELGVDPDEL